ncbi:DMT family transporter [Macrococcoides canis]|uniref:DMT family transporter n=1 Tax=Macrococcoides canis TaxID=1855823 RepID=UPI00105CBC1D|nr:DMT family transporter [Macrococcus canis]MEE1107804.1 DMT family transporter [Macrococcus canis]TDM20430.1 DMT family transporter [Macrococcus canis]
MFYILFAFAAGLVVPIQTAVNSRLRTYVLSPFVASFVSFSVGTIFLLFMTLITKHTLFIDSSVIINEPKWIWIGGILGSFFVFGMSYLVPIIGTGLVVIICLFGQIICSILLDSFGWIGAKQKKVTGVQYLGLTFIFLAIVLICMN